MIFLSRLGSISDFFFNLFFFAGDIVLQKNVNFFTNVHVVNLCSCLNLQVFLCPNNILFDKLKKKKQMYTSEGAQASDFVADQGIYYHPVDPNYAYYCTGIYIFIMLSVLSSLTILILKKKFRL